MISLAKSVTLARCTANAQRINSMQVFNSLKKQSVKPSTLNLKSLKNGMTYYHKTRSGHDLILRKVVGSGYVVEYWHGSVYIHRCFFHSYCTREGLKRIISLCENMLDHNQYIYSFAYKGKAYNRIGLNRMDALNRLSKHHTDFEYAPPSVMGKIKNRV